MSSGEDNRDGELNLGMFNNAKLLLNKEYTEVKHLEPVGEKHFDKFNELTRLRREQIPVKQKSILLEKSHAKIKQATDQIKERHLIAKDSYNKAKESYNKAKDNAKTQFKKKADKVKSVDVKKKIKIVKHKTRIVHHHVHRKVNSGKLSFFILAALIMLSIGFFFIKPGIVGYVILGNETAYSQELGLAIIESQEYDWILEERPEMFVLNSVKLSGKVIGDGDFRIYLRDVQGQKFLILDRDSLIGIDLDLITGYTVDETEEEGIEENITEETEENMTVDAEEEPILVFDNACVNTCSLFGLNQSVYILIFELEQSVELQIDKIEYVVQELIQKEILEEAGIEEEPIILFERAIDCPKCTQNTIPRLTEAQMTITVHLSKPVENAVLTEIFPSEWGILDADGASVSVHDSDNYKMEWDIEELDSSISKTYTIMSPPEKGNYYFQTKLNDKESEVWEITVEGGKQLFRIIDEQKHPSKARIKLKKNEQVVEEFDVDELPEIEEGSYDVEITLEKHPIKRIVLKEVFITPSDTDLIEIDDVAEEKIVEKEFVEVYAINPTAADFTEAEVTAVAKGTELYKCKDWDFAEQSCYGEWTFLQSIVPGQEYTFILTPEDPAFAEYAPLESDNADDCYDEGKATPCIAGDITAISADGGTSIGFDKNQNNPLRVSFQNTTADINQVINCTVFVDGYDNEANTWTLQVGNWTTSTWDDAGTGQLGLGVEGTLQWDCTPHFAAGNDTALFNDLAIRIATDDAASPSSAYIDYVYVVVNYTITVWDDAPYWSNNQTHAVTIYSPAISSYFNITWQDDYNVSTVWLESNYSGSPTNYSMTLINGNLTNGNYSYSAVLPVGSHYWKSYANDTRDLWNQTDKWEFTIAPQTCTTPTQGMTISSDTVLCAGTYYLNDTGNGAININTSNVTIECQGTKLIGNNSGKGIFFDNITEVTIESCYLEDYNYGVHATGSSSDAFLENNTFVSNTYAVVLDGTNHDCNVTNNTFTSNYNSVYFGPLTYLNEFSSNDITSRASGTPRDIDIRGNLNTVTKNDVFSPNLASGGEAIYMDSGASNNTIHLNNLTSDGGAYYGIFLGWSGINDNIITNNTIQGTVTGSRQFGYGVYIQPNIDYRNIIANNTITKVGTGIHANGENTTIDGNYIEEHTGDAIYIYYGGNNCRITNNIINSTYSSAGGGISAVAYYAWIEGNKIYSSSTSNNYEGIDLTHISNPADIGSRYSTVINNIVYNAKRVGIMISEKSWNALVENNTIINSGYQTVNDVVGGIYLYSTRYNTIRNNNISGGGITRKGIHFWYSDPIIYNNITNNTITDTTEEGIRIRPSSGYDKFHHNIIANNTIKNTPNCIYYVHASNNSFISNRVDNCSSYGIYIAGLVMDSTFENNIISNVGIGGIAMYASGDHFYPGGLRNSTNNVISYNKIYNATTFGIRLSSIKSKNNLLIENLIDNASVGINVSGASPRHTFINTTILNTPVGVHTINAEGLNFSNITYTNIVTPFLAEDKLNFSIEKTLMPVNMILRNTSVSEINFTQPITFTSPVFFYDAVELQDNRIFVNSTKSNELNKSSVMEITSASIGADDNVQVDLNDDGTFVLCLPTTEPACSKLSFVGNTTTFNATHFTTFQMGPNEAPYWTNNKSSIAGVYSPSTLSYFNITWQDDIGVSTVWLESNYSGVNTNYSMNNIGGDVYNYSAVLPAGHYYWKSYANDSDDAWNQTDKWEFTIAKAISACTLTINPGSPSVYGTPINASCGCAGSNAPKLYRNGTDVSGENGFNIVLAVGDYNYVCNSSANQNYSYTGDSSDYTITKATSSVNLLLNGTDANYTVNEGSFVNITGEVLAPAGGYIELYLDNNLINSGAGVLTNITLFNTPGEYNVTVVYPATQNYTRASETHYVIVLDVTPPVVTLISPNNGSTVSPNVIFRYNVTDTWSGIGNCSLIFNGSINQTNTSITEGIIQEFALTNISIGNYTWQVNCTDDSVSANEGESEIRKVNVFTCTDNDLDSYSIEGGICGAVDCNDTNSSIYPGAPEVCNGVDDDCNGTIDDGLPIACNVNADCGADGCILGTYYTFTCNNNGTCFSYCSNVTVITDIDLDGYDTECDNDCNDTNASIYPGAPEVCNGVDDDCDNLTDEGFAIICNTSLDCGTVGCIAGTYYSFTCNNNGTCLASCSNVTSITDNDLDGYDTECDGDCDDANNTIYPGAAEVCNGVDDDCNSTVDDGTICNQNFYCDSDVDGYAPNVSNYVCTNYSCTVNLPVGCFSVPGTDCNDSDNSINPGAAEVCDGLDNDCDGEIDEGNTCYKAFYCDNDLDGYKGILINHTCNDSICYVDAVPANCSLTQGDDCNDTNISINPGATEIENGVDDNCDGSIDEGFGAPPSGGGGAPSPPPTVPEEEAPPEEPPAIEPEEGLQVLTEEQIREIRKITQLEYTPELSGMILGVNKIHIRFKNIGNLSIKNISIALEKPPSVEKPDMIHIRKIFGWDFINLMGWITKARITDANLLRWQVSDPKKYEILRPGEELDVDLEILAPLTTVEFVDVNFKILSYRQVIYEEVIPIRINTTDFLVVADPHEDENLIDVYFIITNLKNEDAQFSIELNINSEPDLDYKPTSSLKGLFTSMFEGPNTVSMEWYGPYTVKAKDTVMFAYQYEYTDDFAGEYYMKYSLFEEGDKVKQAVGEFNLKKH
ncbi:hypothetical protein GOV06_05590 [Candidatus Woesearchaeota archaeon]|nr:hypothetical protein [Candidatus Woesearchaeota archaeon]